MDLPAIVPYPPRLLGTFSPPFHIEATSGVVWPAYDFPSMEEIKTLVSTSSFSPSVFGIMMFKSNPVFFASITKISINTTTGEVIQHGVLEPLKEELVIRGLCSYFRRKFTEMRLKVEQRIRDIDLLANELEEPELNDRKMLVLEESWHILEHIFIYNKQTHLVKLFCDVPLGSDAVIPSKILDRIFRVVIDGFNKLPSPNIGTQFKDQYSLLQEGLSKISKYIIYYIKPSHLNDSEFHHCLGGKLVMLERNVLKERGMYK